MTPNAPRTTKTEPAITQSAFMIGLDASFAMCIFLSGLFIVIIFGDRHF